MTSTKHSKRGAVQSERPGISKRRKPVQLRKILRNQPVKATSERQGGLPRPKSQISYNIPREVQALTETAVDSTVTSSLLSIQKDGASRSGSRSSTPTPSSDLAPLVHLSRIVTLLDLVHRRNKNQHRNQNFYKWLNLLRRSIKNLTSLYQRLESLNLNPNKSSTSRSAAIGTLKAESIRKTFELRSELRSQIEVSEEWIRETLVPGCFVSFSAVVADNQFANLGIVLMGVLGDIIGRVGAMRRVDRVPVPLHRSVNADVGKTKSAMAAGVRGEGGGGTTSESERFGRSVLGVSTLITGPDQGEVVERIYSDVDGDGDGDEEENLDMAVKNKSGDEGVRVQRSRDGSESQTLDNHDTEEEMILDKKENLPSNRIHSPALLSTAATASNALCSPSYPQHTQKQQFNPVTEDAPDTRTIQSTISASSSSPNELQFVSQPKPDSNPKSKPEPKYPAQNLLSSAGLKLKPESSSIKSSIPHRIDQKQDTNIPKEDRHVKDNMSENDKVREKDRENKKKQKKKKGKGKGNAIDDLFGGLF